MGPGDTTGPGGRDGAAVEEEPGYQRAEVELERARRRVGVETECSKFEEQARRRLTEVKPEVDGPRWS